MNLTLHEVAHLVHAKNDISQFEDVALVKPELGLETCLFHSRERVMVTTLLRLLLKMEP